MWQLEKDVVLDIPTEYRSGSDSDSRVVFSSDKVIFETKGAGQFPDDPGTQSQPQVFRGGKWEL